MFFWRNLDASKARSRRMSAKEAKALMDAGGVIILDVRTPMEYAEQRILGAINLPNGSIMGGRPKLLPDLDATILVYCLAGVRSAAAARNLAAMGYTKVYDFGGINTWPYEMTR